MGEEEITYIDLINENKEITESKGFNVKQHFPQLLLMVDEVFEAFDHIDNKDRASQELWTIYSSIKDTMEWFRDIRKKKELFDPTTISNEDEFLEEMADLQIRLFSYISQYDKDKFLYIMLSKMDKNRNRPEKHGKKF